MHRRERVTVPAIQAQKSFGVSVKDQDSRKIVAVTAYDFTMARLIDAAKVDLILVGDSLASTVQGLEHTLAVTLDEMIYHARCVTRGVTRALVVGDLPFMSYQVSSEQAIISAGRMVKEGGVGAVKLEGGINIADGIARIVAADIPVLGHIGLTPQSYHRMGGHKVQGRWSGGVDVPGSRERILADAKAVAEAGAFAVVLECVPTELAEEVSLSIPIPTIGIGSGSSCDGQILVSNDLLGLGVGDSPRFVKKFAELGEEVRRAVERYAGEVNLGAFPGPEHTYYLQSVGKKSSIG